MNESRICNLRLSGKYVTDKEIKILKSKNRHIKNNDYETDYENWVESIRNKAFEKCNDCHFCKKYKGVDIYDVDVEIAGHFETKKGDTIFATVRIYQGWENDFVSRIIA